MGRYIVRPEILDAQAQIESGGNPRAVSPKGARGLHQFMPATWAQYGRGDINDPKTSRAAAESYMGDLLDMFEGDESKALAAYNGGQGRLNKVGGDINKMPKESRNYVQKIGNLLNPISSASASEELPKMRTAIITMPNGRDARWEVPYGTAPEEAVRQAHEWYAQQNIETPASGFGHIASLGQRAAIEGVAAVPGQLYNTAQMIAHPIDAIRGETPETNAFGLPTHVDTQQYGSKLADIVGLDKPNELEDKFMQPVRIGAGVGIPGGILTKMGKTGKLAQVMGAGNPVSAAIGAGAGSAAGEVVKAKGGTPAQQVMANVLVNVLTGGVERGAAAMTSSARGARALTAAQKKTNAALKAAGIRGEAANLVESQGDLIPGALPTAAMKYENNAIRDAETMARLRNKEAFYARDEANLRNINSVLTRKAESANADVIRRQLNTITTPMREKALKKASEVGGYELKFREQIEDILTNPATRSKTKLKSLTAPAQAILKRDDIQPIELYEFRKELKDILESKPNPLSTDPMYNAATANRVVTRKIIKSIDEGLDSASGGDWKKYLEAHSAGMKPVNEASAFNRVLEKFDDAAELSPGVKSIAPGALRKSIQKMTYDRQKRDLLTMEGRELADKFKNTANALIRAQSPRGSISGSQTTPLAIQLAKGTMRLKPGLKQLADVFEFGKDTFTGVNVLDEAILNPEKLPALIRAMSRTRDPELIRAMRSILPATQEQ